LKIYQDQFDEKNIRKENGTVKEKKRASGRSLTGNSDSKITDSWPKVKWKKIVPLTKETFLVLILQTNL
jgi:hypothetical protein